MNLDYYQSFLTHDKGNAVFRAEYVMRQFESLKLPERLLDVGCGSGELLRIALQHGVKKVSGVDGMQDALTQCANIPAEICQVDLNSQSLPYADETFSGVACMEVMEHLYDPQKTLQEIYRVLEKGAWAILSVPNQFTYSMRLKILFGENISDPAVIGGHIKFFRPQDLKKICVETGFRSIKILGLAYPTAYKKSKFLANLAVGKRPDLFATWLFACCQKIIK